MGTISTSRKQGVDIFRQVNNLGHYVSSVTPFGKEKSESVDGPTFSAAFSSGHLRRIVQIYLMAGIYEGMSGFAQGRFTPAFSG